MIEWILRRFSKRYRKMVRENNMLARMVHRQMAETCHVRQRMAETILLVLEKEDKIASRKFEQLEEAIRNLLSAHKKKLVQDVARKKAFAKRYGIEERS